MHKSMTTADLGALRRALGLTQTEMGERMGLSMRAYQDAEAGESGALRRDAAGAVKARHALAAERAALTVAVERGNPMLAPPGIRREALASARLITEG